MTYGSGRSSVDDSPLIAFLPPRGCLLTSFAHGESQWHCVCVAARGGVLSRRPVVTSVQPRSSDGVVPQQWTISHNSIRVQSCPDAQGGSHSSCATAQRRRMGRTDVDNSDPPHPQRLSPHNLCTCLWPLDSNRLERKKRYRKSAEMFFLPIKI